MNRTECCLSKVTGAKSNKIGIVFNFIQYWLTFSEYRCSKQHELNQYCCGN